MMDLAPLDRDNLSDLVCLPGGLELAGKVLGGSLERVEAWHRARLDEGMRGFVATRDGRPRGFVEIMPAETAPFPIIAPGSCILLCFHWAGTEPEAEEHLAQERRMLEVAITALKTVLEGEKATS